MTTFSASAVASVEGEGHQKIYLAWPILSHGKTENLVNNVSIVAIASNTLIPLHHCTLLHAGANFAAESPRPRRQACGRSLCSGFKPSFDVVIFCRYHTNE
jgi:hypothetical protein